SGVADRAARVKRGQVELRGHPARMRLPQRDARIPRRARLPAADRAPEEQGRNAVVAERSVLRQVPRICQRQLLVRRLQGRRATVRQSERARVRRECRGEVQLRQIKAGGEPEVPAKSRAGVAVQVEAALAPGAGDDQGLDEIALHAVEARGLMMLVEKPEGHQEQTATGAERLAEGAVDVELL